MGSIGEEESNNHRFGLGIKWQGGSFKDKPKRPRVAREEIAIEKEVVKAVPVKVEPIEPKKELVLYRGKSVRHRVKIYFDSGSSKLAPSEKEKLDNFAKFYHENASTIKHIDVEGHASKIGSKAANEALSFKRSKASNKYLRSLKVPAKVMEYQFHGEDKQAVKTENDNSDLRENRRVEFIIYNNE